MFRTKCRLWVYGLVTWARKGTLAITLLKIIFLRRTILYGCLASLLSLGLFSTRPVLAADDALIMGVFPRRNAKLTFKAFTPLANYLSKKLGRQVVLETSANFQTFWQGVTNNRYDIVHYNQYHYVRSHKKLGYNVIAMNEEFGKSTISGAIDVRVDSSITALAQLKNKKIVFGGGPKAMMSYIVPTYLLRQAGLMKGDYQEAFAKNPPNAILSVYFHQTTAAGVGDSITDLEVVKKKCDTTKIKHLAVSQRLAHLPWAVKSDLAKDLVSKIQNSLIHISQDKSAQKVLNNAGLTGLKRAQDQDYDEHRKIIFEVLGEQY